MHHRIHAPLRALAPALLILIAAAPLDAHGSTVRRRVKPRIPIVAVPAVPDTTPIPEPVPPSTGPIPVPGMAAKDAPEAGTDPGAPVAGDADAKPAAPDADTNPATSDPDAKHGAAAPDAAAKPESPAPGATTTPPADAPATPVPPPDPNAPEEALAPVDPDEAEEWFGDLDRETLELGRPTPDGVNFLEEFDHPVGSELFVRDDVSPGGPLPPPPGEEGPGPGRLEGEDGPGRLDEERGSGPMGEGRGPRMGFRRPGPDLLDALELTVGQREELGRIRERQHEDQIRAQSEVRMATIELQDLIEAEHPDRAKIDAQIDRIAQLRAEQRKAQVASMLEVRALLTAGQLEQLQAEREKVRSGFRHREREERPARPRVVPEDSQ